MLKIIGPTGTPERAAAEEMARLLRKVWPWLEADLDSIVYLLCEVQCHGQTPRDLDVVLLALLPTRPQFQPRSNPASKAGENDGCPVARVASLCVALEIKDHDSRSVRIRGSEVEVAYTSAAGAIEWKSATKQSERQKYSLKKYLEAHVGCSPWIANLIWLRNVEGQALPKGPSNLLPARFTLNGLLNWVAETTRLVRDGHEYVLTATSLADELPLKAAVQFLTATIAPTPLDRRRMDRIAQSSVEKRWLDEARPRQLVFRGRGGTGKTMLLLQVAWRLHRERGRKVLFLTYNHALVSDVRRLMTLLGIGDDISNPRFQVRTAHSFFHSALHSLGVVTPGRDFLAGYEESKDSALQLFAGGALRPSDIDALRREDPETFDWDKILVDEGQDWPRNEMLLLRQLHGCHRLVIADGIDQLVRQDHNCDWLEGLQPCDYEVQPLHSGLRMKRNLASFANALAGALGLVGWEVQPTDEASGGKVIVIEGDYFAASGLHARLVADAAALGNEPVDMLACVPPSLVEKTGDQSRVTMESGFQALDQDIWNGTDTAVRTNTYPLYARQLRIVQYDSCRGLEGWACLNFGLDEFFDHKASLWSPLVSQTGGAVEDHATQSRRYAARWTMIPMTRAMDTLVIQLSQPKSFLAEVLRGLANSQCRDFVEWIHPGQSTS